MKSSARPLFLIFLPTRSGGVCRASARPPPRSLSRAKQHFIVYRSRCHSSQPCYRLATLLYVYSHCNTIIAPLFRVRHTALPLTGLRSLIVGGGPSGLLLAHRLLDAGGSVSLLEGRPDPRAPGYLEGRAYALGLGLRGRTAIRTVGHTCQSHVHPCI